jgi:hypothetical protein
MAADLDGQMAPVRVEDVKRIVVDIGNRVAEGARLPVRVFDRGVDQPG